MTITCATNPDVFRCPTKWELWWQLRANLPRGRAWQTHENSAAYIGGDDTAEAGEFQIGHTGMGEEVRVERLTIMEQWWAAYAEVLEFLHQRACALIEEMFCATVNELKAEWWIDYGFPDPCEPWDALCLKVAAQGGATCDYIAAVAAARGWAVECVDCGGPEAECLYADSDQDLCECINGVIRVRIDSAASPAFDEDWIPMQADAMEADCHDECPAPPEEIRCLIERIKPAHVLAIYEVV